MQELTMDEIDAVGGGLAWFVIAGAFAAGAMFSKQLY